MARLGRRAPKGREMHGLSSTHPFLTEVRCLCKGHLKTSQNRVTQAFGSPLGCIDETEGVQISDRVQIQEER